MLDHSELGEPFNGFLFKFLEPPEYDATINLIVKHLLPCMIPLGYDPRYPDDWIELFSRMMRQDNSMSYIAVHIESGEVAACRMVDLVEKDVAPDLTVSLPPYFKHKSNIDALKLCGDIFKDINIFEMYNVTKYVEMFGLCTDEKYRRMGLAGEMYRRGLNYFKTRGFEIVKCSFISPFTRRAGHKNGFIELARRYFHDCKNEEGQILNPDSDPTDFIDFGVFILRDK